MTVYVSAIMWYKVKDATSAIANVDDYSGSAKLLAATTLRFLNISYHKYHSAITNITNI